MDDGKPELKLALRDPGFTIAKASILLELNPSLVLCPSINEILGK